MKNKNQKGVTLISLVITIIVLGIIIGITVYTGSKTVKEAKLEELRTNMLLIEAKAREYVEEANFKMGPTTAPDYESKKVTVRQEVYETEAKLKSAIGISAPSSIPVSDCYQVTQEALEQWGLDKIQRKEGEYYLIQFDDANATVEIYNTKGYNGKYSLSEIDQIEE